MVRSVFSWLRRILTLSASQLSIFIFDILQAIGGILNVRWAHDGIVRTGPYCTAQGILKQAGELGVALITLVCIVYGPGALLADARTYQILTIHTFMTALWRVGVEARCFAFGVVALTCLFVVLWVGIGNGIHKDFETPTPVHSSGLVIAVTQG